MEPWRQIATLREGGALTPEEGRGGRYSSRYATRLESLLRQFFFLFLFFRILPALGSSPIRGVAKPPLCLLLDFYG